jgi:hypothetical protein
MLEYQQHYKRLRVRIAASLGLLAALLVICAALHVAVPWWVLFFFLLGSLIGGAGYPAYFRLKHHPRKQDRQERRYALAQLVGRPVGFACLIAGALAIAMKTATASAIAPYLVLIGTFLASISVLFRYKGWNEAA